MRMSQNARGIALTAAVILACNRVINPVQAAPGDITVFPLPDQTDFDGPDFPLVGPDGNIWFVEYGTNKIGLIDPKPPNKITEFQLPSNISTGICADGGGSRRQYLVHHGRISRLSARRHAGHRWPNPTEFHPTQSPNFRRHSEPIAQRG